MDQKSFELKLSGIWAPFSFIGIVRDVNDFALRQADPCITGAKLSRREEVKGDSPE
jgi:hypothetical protein